MDRKRTGGTAPPLSKFLDPPLFSDRFNAMTLDSGLLFGPLCIVDAAPAEASTMWSHA